MFNLFEEKEVKFRFWDEDLQEVRYDVESLKFSDENEKPCILSYNNGGNLQSYEVSLMEFTGFRDSKGNEIYVGDIVSGFNDGPAVVSFKKGSFVFELSDYLVYFHDLGGHIKVVGNVYEDAELLERENWSMLMGEMNNG